MRGEERPGGRGVTESARALETRALSLVETSPPDQASPGLEPLTPSPVSFQPERAGNPLGQVKVVNFPAHQTPCVRTPANALRRRRSALRQPGQASSGKTVTVVQPQISQSSDRGGGEYAVLEASQMQGSDLRDLGRNHSNSTNNTSSTLGYSPFVLRFDPRFIPGQPHCHLPE